MGSLVAGIVRYWARRMTCEHQWYAVSDPFDPDEDAACYRDGFNYEPRSYLVCSKCGKKKRTGEDVLPSLWWLLGFPLMLIGGALLAALMPVIILIALIFDEVAKNKHAA